MSLKNFYYNRLLFSYTPEKGTQWEGPVSFFKLFEFGETREKIQRVRSPYQTIDIVKNETSTDDFTLFLNGHYQFDTTREKNYHETMASHPFLKNSLADSSFKRVLILGGGDGLLVRDLLKNFPQLEQIILVELDEKMIEVSQKDPVKIFNEDSLKNPRVTIEINDAFSWLRQSPIKDFDAIYLDFPYPFDEESLRLYSVEIYKLAFKKLKPNGYLMADYPLDAFKEKNSERTAETFYSAGFQKVWWLQIPGESFILASVKDRQIWEGLREAIDFKLLERNFRRKDYQSVLKPHSFMKGDRFF